MQTRKEKVVLTIIKFLFYYGLAAAVVAVGNLIAANTVPGVTIPQWAIVPLGAAIKGLATRLFTAADEYRVN
jgi:hypothetical protein